MDKIIDITTGLYAGAARYPGDPDFERVLHLSQMEGDPVNVSVLKVCSHHRTHVDAPSHYMIGGKTIDQIELSQLVGRAYVVDCRGLKSIGVADLQERLPNEQNGAWERVLIKTDYSACIAEEREHEAERHTALEEKAARFLAEREVQLVGIDDMSVDAMSDATSPCHFALLSRGIVILEMINLHEVAAGWYELLCMPLLIRGGEAAPCRAALRKMAAENGEDSTG